MEKWLFPRSALRVQYFQSSSTVEQPAVSPAVAGLEGRNLPLEPIQVAVRKHRTNAVEPALSSAS
jgi:hypothetical protein